MREARRRSRRDRRARPRTARARPAATREALRGFRRARPARAREIAHALEVRRHPVEGRRAVVARRRHLFADLRDWGQVRVQHLLLVSHARRACAIPSSRDQARRRVRVGVRDQDPGLAGESRAHVAQVEPVGWPVISARSRSAARVMTRSTSISPATALGRRPVRRPMQSTCGLSITVRIRSVDSRLNDARSEATTSRAGQRPRRRRRASRGAEVRLDPLSAPGTPSG